MVVAIKSLKLERGARWEKSGREFDGSEGIRMVNPVVEIGSAARVQIEVALPERGGSGDK